MEKSFVLIYSYPVSYSVAMLFVCDSSHFVVPCLLSLSVLRVQARRQSVSVLFMLSWSVFLTLNSYIPICAFITTCSEVSSNVIICTTKLVCEAVYTLKHALKHL